MRVQSYDGISIDQCASLRLIDTMNDPLPDALDHDARMQITAQLNAARQHAPELADAEPGDLLRHVRGKRAVFQGQMAGRDVVFRLNLTPENGVTQREWAELQRLWPYMATGNLRTPEPICAAPEAGVIVQEHVIGTPLLKLLYGIEPEQRLAWLAPAAAWLRQSTAMSQEMRTPRPDGWIARAARASAQQPFPQLRALEVQILEQMQNLAPKINTEPWRAAICHGDYHPNNLIANGARLTGIDLGGSGYLPLMKDIARFAMHMGRRRIRLSGETRLGVDQACLREFADTFALSEVERSATLPFFLAFEALIRIENTSLPAARIERAKAAYRGLLQDLCDIGKKATLI